MKRVILFASIGLVLFIGILFFSFNYLFQRPCDPPERPSNVPANAIWAGGCDGGHWIELISVLGDKYQFKIYRSWDGALNMHANFEPEGCDSLDFTTENWKQKVVYYVQENGPETKIVLKDIDRTCSLKGIYPAYGGDDWEIIKEKYNL